jgi:hypothetical protein
MRGENPAKSRYGRFLPNENDNGAKPKDELETKVPSHQATVARYRARDWAFAHVVCA